MQAADPKHKAIISKMIPNATPWALPSKVLIAVSIPLEKKKYQSNFKLNAATKI
jgi:hypothetical protein